MLLIPEICNNNNNNNEWSPSRTTSSFIRGGATGTGILGCRYGNSHSNTIAQCFQQQSSRNSSSIVTMEGVEVGITTSAATSKNTCEEEKSGVNDSNVDINDFFALYNEQAQQPKKLTSIKSFDALAITAENGCDDKTIEMNKQVEEQEDEPENIGNTEFYMQAFDEEICHENNEYTHQQPQQEENNNNVIFSAHHVTGLQDERFCRLLQAIEQKNTVLAANPRRTMLKTLLQRQMWVTVKQTEHQLLFAEEQRQQQIRCEQLKRMQHDSEREERLRQLQEQARLQHKQQQQQQQLAAAAAAAAADDDRKTEENLVDSTTPVLVAAPAGPVRKPLNNLQIFQVDCAKRTHNDDCENHGEENDDYLFAKKSRAAASSSSSSSTSSSTSTSTSSLSSSTTSQLISGAHCNPFEWSSIFEPLNVQLLCQA